MPTECSAERFDFGLVGRREVVGCYVSVEYLAGRSYIDMTRCFRRSNGKVHVTSTLSRRLFESLEAAHSEESGHEGDEAMIFAPAAGAEFSAHLEIAAIIDGKRDGTVAFS